VSAGTTVIIAGAAAGAGVYAANVIMEDWTHVPYDPVNVAAVGGVVGAVLGTLIGVMTTAADAKKTGTVGDLPLPRRELRFP
jgi:hypothetical protein